MATKKPQVIKVAHPARKKRKRSDDSMPDFGKMMEVEEQELLKFAEDQMRVYGQETNLERSVPDYRDGLKPVGRRVLWGLSQLPKEQNVKSARVVGDVMGKYHPHGDLSIYTAVTTLVNFSVPPIDGEGGWGTLIDGPAAMRYTNVRLSPFGKTFFLIRRQGQGTHRSARLVAEPAVQRHRGDRRRYAHDDSRVHT